MQAARYALRQANSSELEIPVAWRRRRGLAPTGKALLDASAASSRPANAGAGRVRSSRAAAPARCPNAYPQGHLPIAPPATARRPSLEGVTIMGASARGSTRAAGKSFVTWPRSAPPCSGSARSRYHPWNVTHIALRLQDEGAAMVEFRQGFRSMAAPTRSAPRSSSSRRSSLTGGNPVTLLDGRERRRRPGPRRQPEARQGQVHRAQSHGIVAIIMAIGRAMLVQRAPSPPTRCFICDLLGWLR